MGNSDSNPWIGLTQSFQEIEKIRFSYDLRKNPDDFNRYVSERIDRITNETLDKKRAAFQKAHTDLGRYMDMDHNSNFYKLRNNDLIGLQEQMSERSRAAVSGLKHDKDLTRRQVEINQWYFEDKLETLFFLQMFFIVMLAEAIVVYLQRNGYITMPFASFLTAILFAIVTAVGLYRWRYTADKRDVRFWHRRNFREKEIVCSGPKCNPKKTCKDPEEPEEKTCPGPDIMGPLNGAAAFAADVGGPYAGIVEDTAMGVGAGAAVIGLGGAIAVGSVLAGPVLLGNQALKDGRSLTNKAGSRMSAASTQLEADTIAYITGDKRQKVQPAECAFGEKEFESVRQKAADDAAAAAKKAAAELAASKPKGWFY